MRAVELVCKAMERLIWVLFALMTVYLFLMSIFSTSIMGKISGEVSKTFYIGDNFVIHVLVIAAIFGGGGLLYPKISRLGNTLEKKSYWLLAFYMVLGVLFVVCTQMFPIADQRELLYIAENVKNGDFSDFYPGARNRAAYLYESVSFSDSGRMYSVSVVL